MHPILDAAQSADQVGLRTGVCIEDAFACLEGILGRFLEFEIDLWIASLDMKKACDRIDFTALFEALEEVGLDKSYIHLLACLYARQRGSVNDSRAFDVQRGGGKIGRRNKSSAIQCRIGNGFHLNIPLPSYSLSDDMGICVGSSEQNSNIASSPRGPWP